MRSAVFVKKFSAHLIACLAALLVMALAVVARPVFAQAPAAADKGAAPAIPRKLEAESAQFQLIELINSVERIQDITVERLRAYFSVDFVAKGPRLTYRGRMTQDWWLEITLDSTQRSAPNLRFHFAPNEPGTHPASTQICFINFYYFGGLIKQTKVRTIVSHDQGDPPATHMRFERANLLIDAFFRDEFVAADRAGNRCVSTVIVR